MKKYKVYVYAICKNEQSFVKRWVESMKEADGIYVLDTGSTDETVFMLKSENVVVHQEKITPWRFDVARNRSLDFVPLDADICVCTDLDEVFEKGWREELEKVWDNQTTRAQYTYHWKLDEDDVPLVTFYLDKIHSRHGYRWIHPVHEVLSSDNNQEQFVTATNMVLKHYPDNKKSRSSYLPLLELSVKEDPLDDRNMHYLGREYMYYHRYQEAIDALIRHLSLPKAVWKDERAASMRFIARCYVELKRYEEAKMWFNKAIEEAPYLRDAYIELALLFYQLKDWKKVKHYVTEALTIKERKFTYINEIFSWNETPYDLLSLSLFYLGDIPASLDAAEQALKLNPNDIRLKNNRDIIFKSLNHHN